jgi:hypothetical protein
MPAQKPSSLVDKAQVGDMGIDGRIYPVTAIPRKAGGTGLRPVCATGKMPVPPEQEATATQVELGFMDHWYPIQVKQKDKVGRPDVDAFEAVMMREERTKGFFVAFDYSQDAITEINRFFTHSGKAIVALTVKEILDEQIAMKLA